MNKIISTAVAMTVAAGVATLIPVAAANAAPTATAVKTYSTCEALTQKFPYGVRQAPGLVNRHTADKNKPLTQRRVVDRKNRPVAAGIYRKNVHLDFDKDGIACER